jgi:hypothetical protein
MITRNKQTTPGGTSAYIQAAEVPQSRAVGYDISDWQELNELCKRAVDTPRALLSRERIAEILAQPEERSRFSHPAKLRKAQAEARNK